MMARSGRVSGRILSVGSSSAPHPEYLITLVGTNSGAGSGVPGAAVRDAATGRVVDRVAGRMDVYSAVAGTRSARRCSSR